MSHSQTNRFQDFFKEGRYILLKNYLYNYLLRKMAVEKHLQNPAPGLILEVGSGISPVMTRTTRIIYTDLSFSALRILRDTHQKGWYITADCMHLPFKSGSFACTICSEVLEHLPDDRNALREMARVLRKAGHIILTFPHRKRYFANDDRFVNHLRRYELHEMQDRLSAAGFKPVACQRVLGPIEKVTMCFIVYCFSRMQRVRPNYEKEKWNSKVMMTVTFLFKWINRAYMGIAWADARIMPTTIATILLIKAEKNTV
ncbi:MAG: class I SAM-dependent methyltransferase [Deltaproteobacteria bacterium]|nr:class I SAM-dependent methyltransferase [Deltaproteobacteria bacterium]